MDNLFGLDEEEQIPYDPNMISPGMVAPPEQEVPGYTPQQQVALNDIRKDRDAAVRNAGILEAVGDISAAVGSQGRIKPDSSFYDSLRKGAQDKAKEAQTDIETKRKAVADFIRNKALAKKAEENDQYRKEGRELQKAALAESQAMRRSQADEMAAQRAFQRASEFRKEYSGLPTSKASQDVAQSYSKIEKSAKDPSAAGDIALLTGYMKLIDPGSTVREGEFANAQNAGGIPDKIIATYNKALNGERLSETQRADFVKQARVLARSQRDTQKNLESQFVDKAKRLGLNPEEITTDYFNGLSLDEAPMGPPPAGGWTPEKEAKLQKLKAKLGR